MSEAMPVEVARAELEIEALTGKGGTRQPSPPSFPSPSPNCAA
jgi:hypothetical protein